MSKSKLKIRHILAVAGAFAFTANSQVWAAATDLATVPLATSSGTVVRPNLLFTLDDSGSMAWDYLPDYVGGGMGTSYPHCKPSAQCNNGMPPFQAGGYNGVAYNPAVTYAPPVNADGTLKNSQTCANTGGTSCAAAPYTNGWTSVKVDGYNIQNTGTINLLTGYGDMVYCDNNIGVCKQNGIDTNNPFFEDATGSGNPPNYALPGTMSVPSTTTVSSTSNLFNGTLNGATTAQQGVSDVVLNNGSPVTTSITLNSPSVSLSGTQVTLTYTSQSPATPVIVSGDNITVSGTSCSSGFVVTNTAITMGAALTLTYAGGTKSKNNTCGTATVTHKTTPSVAAPSISSDGTTVTVTLSAAHGLVPGDVVTIGNRTTGTCDAGYKATSVTATVVNSTTFTYPVALALGTASNTSCNITKAVTTLPSAPGISIAGNVVTVKLTGHGLANNDVVQVTGASCGTAFKTITTPGVVVSRIDANTFTYASTTPAGTTGLVCKIDHEVMAMTTAVLTSSSTQNGAPYEYVIIPVEFCDTPYLTNCVASSVPTTVSSVSYSYPAPVRYCKNAATAALAPGNAGAQTSGAGAINCQGKFSDVTGLLFKSVRYGLFYRVDVLPARATYGNEVLNTTVNANGTSTAFNSVTVLDRSLRNDCAAAPNCTYAEEMTNFANWYAYYHTRMQMMKTSAGKAFSTMDSGYRIGFVTINASSWTNEYLPVAQFTSAQKTSFYSKFYAINPGNSTPLREALARAGRYFAGKHGLPGDSMNDDPMEYSCQQNFTLLTTDGYWNGTTSSVVNLGGTQMGNRDNADSGLSKRSFGVYDGGCAAGSYSSGGCADTLADVAQYYYATDLRTPALANCTSGSATGATLCSTPSPSTDPDPYNNVPTPGTSYDPANWQHMVTFTLGLADGLMLYQPDYATSASGDFSKIKTAATGCDFSGAGTCNWPTPMHDTQTALDDLWHAAVNGRGTYYNARDPNSLAKGLGGALSAMKVQVGAAAASATSSPNITRTDRSIFSSTYRTVNWDGEVQAQLLDPATGNVPTTALTALPVFSSVSLSGSTVSVTMTAHGLTSGDMIQVQNTTTGTCDSGYNTGGQSRTVTVVNANQFTYTGTLGGATTNTQCQFYIAGVVWSAQTQLDIKVNAAIATGTDPEIRARYIVTYDQSQAMPLSSPGNGVKEFRYNKLTGTEAAWFDNKCAFATLSQCTTASLTLAEIASGNLGSNLVPYLRGNTALEQTTPNPTYRTRQHFLGDTVNAKPNYVRAPLFNFTDPAWQANHAYTAGDTFLNAGINYLVNTPYTSAAVFGVVDTNVVGGIPNAEVATSYASFLSASQTREAELYIAANDGMLHAFDAGQCTGTPVVCTTGTGNETWAYVPRMVMPNIYKLADVAYGGNHQFFVDGSPETMDIYVGSVEAGTSGLSAGWHTILVGGLGGGGRGFYALDITNPLVPVALWEVCSDSTLCNISDNDLGYSYGNPVITKRSSDNRWVVLVTSGYNNIPLIQPSWAPNHTYAIGDMYTFNHSVYQVTAVYTSGAAYGATDTAKATRFQIGTGDGQGYLYVLDAVNGAILSKIPTGSGSTATPSGLAKISAWADDGNTNNEARFVYGGDLNGDVWRFDLGAPGTTATVYPALSSPATRFTTLVDSAGAVQPITTRPELGDVNTVSGSIDSLHAIGKPVIFIGTGRYLGASDQSNTQTESIYALRDDFSTSVSQVNSRTRADIVQQTISLTNGTSSNNTVDWTVKNGWYADFPVVGERVNIDPVLTLGTLVVVTNLPGSSSCETGGTSFLYQFNYKNGNNVPSAVGGVVRSKIGNALTVGIVVVRLPSGQLRVIATSAAGAKINEGVNVSGTASTRNVSWRELIQ